MCVRVQKLNKTGLLARCVRVHLPGDSADTQKSSDKRAHTPVITDADLASTHTLAHVRKIAETGLLPLYM